MNRFSKYITVADAAIGWQQLSQEETDLVVLDEDGLPYLAGVPDLTLRASALVEAVSVREITGATTNEDGYPLKPQAMRLDRDSVRAWIAESDARQGASAEPLRHKVDVSAADILLTHAEAHAYVVKSGRKLAKSTLYAHSKSGKFPAALDSSDGQRWKKSEVDAWIAGAGRWSVAVHDADI